MAQEKDAEMVTDRHVNCVSASVTRRMRSTTAMVRVVNSRQEQLLTVTGTERTTP